jgi:signal transduction histidine kinase/CheY-like chemotaxis protein
MSELDGLKLLKRIEEGVAGKTGEPFFRQLIRDLAEALDAHAAFTSHLLPDRRARMLAFWVGGRYEQCLEYALAGTPCDWVYQGRITSFACDVGETFPLDREWFRQLGGITSYLGIPVKDESATVIGHLAVMDTRERDWREADVDVLRLFSLRAAAELERFRHHQNLEAANAALHEANERLREEIARRHAVEEQLAAAKIAAEAANQAKSVFISNMSHELRTPLNGILGYAQLLRRNGAMLAQEQLDGLAVIEHSGEHLLNLVNDLLDIARIEAGRLELHPAGVELPELLRGVADLLRVRAKNAELAFEYACAGALPSHVVADARALRQVLLNLIGNAVMFWPRGGRVNLTVRGSAGDGERCRLELVVADTGVGIPADQLERIYEPFYRVAVGDGAVEGTGLGLAITRRLVEAMGGTVSVASEVGRGTRFTVTIDVPVAHAGAAEQAGTIDIVGWSDDRARTAVVADDDPVNRGLVAEVLQGVGFMVRQATNGADALEALRAHPADLLVTDLVMPKLDGMALVRELRADERLRGVRVLALSASASDYTRAEALQGGCDGFLPKPLRLPALFDEVRRLLGLAWVLRDADAPAAQARADGTSATSGRAVDASVAAELYHLALRGDITALVARAEETLGRDPGASGLHEELRALARSYDTGAIRRLLAPHVPVDPSPPAGGAPAA